MATAAAPDTSRFSGVEKAAILVMYLEEPVVRQVFGQLAEDEIRRIGEAISRLDRVEPDVVQAVVTEFATELNRSLFLQTQGQAYLQKVFPAVLGPERAHRMLRSIEPVTRNDFQRTFGRIQPGALAARLRREHPQTIAVACAVLGAKQTAAILPSLDSELQVEVMLRLGRLRQVPLDVLEDIEDLLGRGEEAGGAPPTMTADGARLVADAIAGLKSEHKEELLAALSQRDEQLAGSVSRQMFQFSMLNAADNKGVQNLLKEVERKDLALALKGAEPATRDKFFSNMSERAAQYLRDDMEAMGAVRLSEVETAQQQIIALALRLEEEGKLVLLGAGEALVE